MSEPFLDSNDRLNLLNEFGRRLDLKVDVSTTCLRATAKGGGFLFEHTKLRVGRPDERARITAEFVCDLFRVKDQQERLKIIRACSYNSKVSITLERGMARVTSELSVESTPV